MAAPQRYDAAMDLMLLRHAKSDWDAGAADDHSRPLATRGVRSAERMGEVLRDLGLVPDIVVSSTALRARSTAELARISGGWDSRLVLDDALYGASVGETLAVAATHGDRHERVMLVGHEPTWSMTVRQVTGARAEIRTGTCAVIEMHTDVWDEVPVSSGSLVTLLQPRHFLR
jgi:phosphohistidine phosphatase